MSQRLHVDITGDEKDLAAACGRGAAALGAVGAAARAQDDDLKRSAGIWQDAAGRWRNAAGQFASAAELAAAGVDDVDVSVRRVDRTMRFAQGGAGGLAGALGGVASAGGNLAVWLPVGSAAAQTLGVQLLQLGASAGPAVGGLLAIPAGAGIAAQALATLGLGLNGVLDAVRQTEAAQEAAAAGTIRTARAQQTAADTIERTHEQVRSAVLAERDAQEQLNDARDQAKQDLVDIELLAAGAAIAQQRSALELIRARRNVRRAQADPESSETDVEDVRIALLEAEQRHREAGVRARRAGAEQRAAMRDGVEGSDRVVAARRQLAEAERQVARAQRDSARAATAAATATAAQAPAIARLNRQLEELTPEARELVGEILDLKEGAEDLGREIQRAMIPGILAGLEAAAPAIEPLSDILVRTGGAFGVLAERGGRLLGSDGFLTVFERVGGRNVEHMTLLADAGMDLGEALVVVLDAGGPFLDWMARGVGSLGELARAEAWAGRESGAIAEFFDASQDSIQTWGGILVDATGGLIGLGRAAFPFGMEIADGLGRSADEFNRWANSTEGQERLTSFFEDLEPVVDSVNGLVGQLFESLAGLSSASGDEAAGFLDVLADAIPVIEGALTVLVDEVGPPAIELLQDLVDLADEVGEGIEPWAGFARPALGVLGGLVNRVEDLIDLLPDVAKLPAALAIGAGTLAGWRRLRELMAARSGGLLGGGGAGTTGVGPAGTLRNPIAVLVVGERDGDGGRGGRGGAAPTGGGRGRGLAGLGAAGGAAAAVGAFANAGTAAGGPGNRLNAAVQGADPTNALMQLLGLPGLTGLLLPGVRRTRFPTAAELANWGMGISPDMAAAQRRWREGRSEIPTRTRLTDPGGGRGLTDAQWQAQALRRLREEGRSTAGAFRLLEESIAQTQRRMRAAGTDPVLERGLVAQRGALRDLRGELAWDFGARMATMLRRSRSASDQNVGAILRGLGELPPGARKHSADMAVGMAAVMEERGELPKGSARRIRTAIVGEFDGMKLRAVRASADMAGGMTATFGSLAGVVGAVMGAIGEMTNENLRALGVRPVRFAAAAAGRAIDTAGALAGDFSRGLGGLFAGGGWIGDPNARGRDEIPIWVGEGEAVINAPQQPHVQNALAFAHAHGVTPYGSLGALFRGEQTEHWRFARGGIVGDGPGRMVTASRFGGPDDPSAYMRTTASGATANETLWGWAELSDPPSSLNFAALGDMPMGSMLEIAYGGRSVTAPKVDVGGGGPGLNGLVRAVDMTWAVARALGFPDLANVLVRGAIGGPSGMAGALAAIAELVAPRLTGPPGAMRELGQGAISAVTDAANQYVAQEQQKLAAAMAASAAAGGPGAINVSSGLPADFGNLGTIPDADGALPGLDLLAAVVGRLFGLHVSDGIRAPGTLTTSGNVSAHTYGTALDLTNVPDEAPPSPQMDDAEAWLRMTIGAGGPRVEDYAGGAIDQMLFRTTIGGNHFDHIHVQLTDYFARNPDALWRLINRAGRARGLAMGGFAGADPGGDPRIAAAAGRRLQLPMTFGSTHDTAGLAGYPAIDVFGAPGTTVLSPADGTVSRLSGSLSNYAGPGGPYGYSIYLASQLGEYFMTHFGSRLVDVGDRVTRGQPIGTIADYPGSVPDHIHEGLRRVAGGAPVPSPTSSGDEQDGRQPRRPRAGDAGESRESRRARRARRAQERRDAAARRRRERRREGRARRRRARRQRRLRDAREQFLERIERFLDLSEGEDIDERVDGEQRARSDAETLYGQMVRRFSNDNAMLTEDEQERLLVSTLAGDWTEGQIAQLVPIKTGEIDSASREAGQHDLLELLGQQRIERSDELIAKIQARRATNSEQHARNVEQHDRYKRWLAHLNGQLRQLARVTKPNRAQRGEMRTLRELIRDVRGRDERLMNDDERLMRWDAKLPDAAGDVEGEVTQVWRPMVAAAADAKNDISRVIIPNLQLDIAELGARPPKPARPNAIDNSEQILALTRQLLAQSQEALAVSDAQFDVFASMRPLVGRFDHGTRFVPETGIALVHRGEMIQPDPEGAFASQLRTAAPAAAAAAPQITLVVEGDIAPLLKRMRAEVDGRAARVVSEQLAQRARMVLAGAR